MKNSYEIFVTFSQIVMDLHYGYKAQNTMIFYRFRHEAAQNLLRFSKSDVNNKFIIIVIYSIRGENKNRKRKQKKEGFEPRPQGWETCALPLYHSTSFDLSRKINLYIILREALW